MLEGSIHGRQARAFPRLLIDHVEQGGGAQPSQRVHNDHHYADKLQTDLQHLEGPTQEHSAFPSLC